MPVPSEIETCFVVRRVAVFARLPAVLARLAKAVSAPVRRDIEDALLDTDDLLLSQADAALRLRLEPGRRAELTLKSLAPFGGGLAVRAELSEWLRRVPREPAGPCPGRRIAARVQRVLRDRPLRVCFRLRQQRTVYAVRTRDGAHLLVSADTVHLPGPKARPIHEIEIELREGDREALMGFSRALCAALPLIPAERSKYDLGLRAAGLRRPQPAGPASPGRSASAAEVLAFVLRKQSARLCRHERRVRLDLDPEAVHDLRVACRRLRAALQLLGPVAGPLPVRSMCARLARVARRLGDVRDLDVHNSALETRATRLPPAGRRALQACVDRLRRQREQAHIRLLAVLETPRFAACCQDLAALADRLAELPAQGKSAGSARRAAHPLVRRLLRRVQRLGDALQDDTPDADLHRLRIRVKKLRYVCEFMKDAGGPAVGDFAARAARLQDALGRYQDLVVEESRLGRLLASREGRRTPVVRAALEALLADAATDGKTARRDCLTAWRRFDRRPARRKLLAALR